MLKILQAAQVKSTVTLRFTLKKKTIMEMLIYWVQEHVMTKVKDVQKLFLWTITGLISLKLK